MALYKRKSTWWTDFSVNGQRFRASLDTNDWRDAQAREKDFITQAGQGKLAPASQQFARLSFSEPTFPCAQSRALHGHHKVNSHTKTVIGQFLYADNFRQIFAAHRIVCKCKREGNKQAHAFVVVRAMRMEENTVLRYVYADG